MLIKTFKSKANCIQTWSEGNIIRQPDKIQQARRGNRQAGRQVVKARASRKTPPGGEGGCPLTGLHAIDAFASWFSFLFMALCLICW